MSHFLCCSMLQLFPGLNKDLSKVVAAQREFRATLPTRETPNGAPEAMQVT